MRARPAIGLVAAMLGIAASSDARMMAHSSDAEPAAPPEPSPSPEPPPPIPAWKMRQRIAKAAFVFRGAPVSKPKRHDAKSRFHEKKALMKRAIRVRAKLGAWNRAEEQRKKREAAK